MAKLKQTDQTSSRTGRKELREGNYSYLLTGATCHDDRRRRTSHLKNYHSRKKNTCTDNDNGEQDMKIA